MSLSVINLLAQRMNVGSECMPEELCLKPLSLPIRPSSEMIPVILQSSGICKAVQAWIALRES